ncbi:MAG: hypothetical protein ABIE74_02745, partial [Pseudomonadota bacterium]
LRRASTPGLLRPVASLATCRMDNSHGKLLSAYKSDQIYPGAPSLRKRLLLNQLPSLIEAVGELSSPTLIGDPYIIKPLDSRFHGNDKYRKSIFALLRHFGNSL